jgi:predicted enzyme related to lactoylglutathione lyase
MNEALKTIIYPVSDLAAAKAVFTTLVSAEPYIDEPYYVAFDASGQDVGLDPNGRKKGLTGATPFFHVTDIKATLQGLVEAGAETVQEIQNVGAGNLIASVKDPDGNLIGLFQTG